MYRVDVIRGRGDAVLREILSLSRAATPASWAYPDEEEYYGEQLANARAIHLLLRRGEEAVGYLFALPLDEVLADEEFRRADPELRAEGDRLYVETMTILPRYVGSLVGGRLCLLLLRVLSDQEAPARGFRKFAMHARVATGLNRVVRSLYEGMVTASRTIERWPYYGGEEPTEYLEITYTGRTCLPKRCGT